MLYSVPLCVFDFLAVCYEKKVQTVVIDNPTNINKASHHLSPQVIEHKNDKA